MLMNQNLSNLIQEALQSRSGLIENLEAENTDTYRLFHGITEGCPGLTIDKYGPQILIQTFRHPLPPDELAEIKTILEDQHNFQNSFFIYHHRTGSTSENIPVPGAEIPPSAQHCRELNVKYKITGTHRGIDPLLFIDLRSARRFVMENCRDKSLLNLFAYTCGVGTAAAVAGAKEIWNVDFALSNLDHGRHNSSLNNIPASKIRFIHQDVIPTIRQLAGLGVKGKSRKRKFLHFKPRDFDIVFLDPPTRAKSAFGLVDIINDYQGIFKPALLCTKPGGMIICTNHAAQVELEYWLELLKRCANKAGSPLKQIHVIEPEADFPSPDKKFPLKIAACRI